MSTNERKRRGGEGSPHFLTPGRICNVTATRSRYISPGALFDKLQKGVTNLGVAETNGSLQGSKRTTNPPLPPILGSASFRNRGLEKQNHIGSPARTDDILYFY
jgi:hypothetical protein